MSNETKIHNGVTVSSTTEENGVDLELALNVMHSEKTAAYIYGCMLMGNGIRILCELGALPDEIRMAVEDNIKLHISPESQIILP